MKEAVRLFILSFCIEKLPFNVKLVEK